MKGHFRHEGMVTAAALCLFVAPLAAQSMQVPLKPVRAVNYYPWVSFLTQSAIEPHPNPTPGVTLRALRVVLATVESEERLYLESVTLGPEECCNRIDAIVQVDLTGLARTFGLKPPLREITFSRWLTTRSFSIEAGGREFLLSLDEDHSLKAELRLPAIDPQ